MKHIYSFIAILLVGLLPITSCAQTNQRKEQNMKEKKILVAFFSRAGENYAVGHIEKGNTHIIAEMIAAETDGDLFHIEPVTPYPDDYTECTEVAKQELNVKARPAIKGDIKRITTSSSSVIPTGGATCRCLCTRLLRSTVGRERLSSRSVPMRAADCPVRKTN